MRADNGASGAYVSITRPKGVRQCCCSPRTSQGGLLDAEGRRSDLQDAEVRRNLVTDY